MAERKLLTYYIMISRVFPAYHPRAGEETYFKQSILTNKGMVYESAQNIFNDCLKDLSLPELAPKIHTIRGNYDLWARRAEKINKGEAILSLRQWTGSPYNFKCDGSTQKEFMVLNKINVQPIAIHDCRLKVDRGKNKNIHALVDGNPINFNKLYENDGLNFRDFCDWFKMDTGKKLFSMDGCVIQFTEFKY